MENASKALIMAGSILISIMVISLLVLGYNQLKSLEQTRENADATDKMAEYMRRFEQFDRTVYGSELFSLGNLQQDYNASDARVDVGYDRIEITVVTDGIVNSPYFAAGTYNLDAISNDQAKIESQLAQYEKAQKKYNNRSVKYYSSKRNREIANDFDMDPPSSMPDYDIATNYLETNSTTAELLQEIQDYKEISTIYNEFRTGKKFRCTNVVYNNQNGRIRSMYFEEI